MSDSDDEDYNSEEDVDYVPVEGEQVSEEENSGDEEDLTVLHDADNQVSSLTGKRKTTRKKPLLEPRKRRGGIKLDGEEAGNSGEQTQEDEEEKARKKELAAQIAKEEEEKKKEKEKKKADDLWASFMSDVKPVHRKPATVVSSVGSHSTEISSTKEEKKESSHVEKEEPQKTSKVTITKVFDFAGEEVKITKEVDANSKEAKQEQKKQEKAKEEQEKQKTFGTSSLLGGGPSASLGLGLGSGLKRPASGGLGSVLNKIGKKNKMGTLEKSKMDWESFKSKEGIEEDLKIHNKGKQGYTERMAFLNRADQREYEIERDLRLSSSKR